MNDIEFIEKLKQKRNACDYSQSRLAQELQISRQNLNEIENGKTKASKEMKHILLHYLDYCNCTQPFTLTIDYLRVRFPTTDALEIIKNVLAMKSEYFIHEDYGMFGYEEQYIYGDISVNASKDSSMGVLLELSSVRIVAGLCGLRQIRQIKRHTVIMLAVTTDSLAKVLVLCTISVMMCCIKPYWNDCSIGLRQYSKTKKRC